MTGPLMKILEVSPSSYETLIGLVTLGKMKIIRNRILHYLGKNKLAVLDAGCGVGGILEEILQINENVEINCIDKSNEVIGILTKKFDASIKKEKLHVIDGDIMSNKTLDNELKYDVIINTHLLSEIEPEFIYNLLERYNSYLNCNGLIFIADELSPNSKIKKAIFHLLRTPLDFISYLVDKHKEIRNKSFWAILLFYVLEFPLIIFSYFPNAPITHPLKNIEEKLINAGFEIIEQIKFQFDTFGLYVARKR